MHLREEIARARSGDSICRDRIADRLAHGLSPDWGRSKTIARSEDGSLVSAPSGAAAPNGHSDRAATHGNLPSGAKPSDLLDSVLRASDCLDELPDELPLDFRLKLAGPGLHLDGAARVEAVRTAGLLALLLLDAPSRDLLCAHMYDRKSIYAIARDLGEDELEVGSRYLRALQAWLQLSSGFIERGALAS